LAEPPTVNLFTASGEEAPPAYSNYLAPHDNGLRVPSPASSNRSALSAASISTPDDPFAFLTTFDTAFLIDDSGSMAGRSWRECENALVAITPICTSHDPDGIDIYFLNAKSQPVHFNVSLASTVQEIFQTVRPRGDTPTGQRLNAILKPYLAKYERDPESTRPLNVICITDGVPTDDVESVLISAARKLDKLDAVAWQLGVQFVQIGEERGAREHLESLDDELSKLGEGCRDIVDTVPFVSGQALSADKILKVVLGAVNRRLDRRAN